MKRGAVKTKIIAYRINIHPKNMDVGQRGAVKQGVLRHSPSNPEAGNISRQSLDRNITETKI
jgi:hypothetical protein